MYKQTYVNPIVLPDYPLGRSYFLGQTSKNYRETADPTVLFDNGKWYLYSSCGMGYVSEDFVNWKKHRIEPYDMGYAPSVAKHKGRYYLVASFISELYASDSPLGPFEVCGTFTTVDGEKCSFFDAMIFSDDDEKLYIYGGGCNGVCGIVGAQLDENKPWQLLTPIKTLLTFKPEEHTWECFGEWNQNKALSFIEGPFMYKKNGTYYLTYTAPGTQYSTYAMGVYKSISPLEGFEYQKNNPFVSKKYGIVRGPGHGCIVDGPNESIWVFYTCTMCYTHEFERRIGMDCAYIDDNGDLCVKNVTEIPQWAPGLKPNAHLDNNAGLLPLTFRENTYASSNVYGREPIYATDDSMLTWWEPEKNDKAPELTVEFFAKNLYTVNCARIIWRDVGMNFSKNIYPGAFGYIIEVKDENGNWICAVDKSESEDDYNIDYIVFDKPVIGNEIRLRITKSPNGITPGVISFCAFGAFYK